MEISDRKGKADIMSLDKLRSQLVDKLKKEHCFWSYDNASVQDVPDDVLIELVMLYLDVDDISLLFKMFPYKRVKKAWLENVVAQGERFQNLNYFFAWYYFKARQPKRYVRSMMTRQLHKRMG